MNKKHPIKISDRVLTRLMISGYVPALLLVTVVFIRELYTDPDPGEFNLIVFIGGILLFTAVMGGVLFAILIACCYCYKVIQHLAKKAINSITV